VDHGAISAAPLPRLSSPGFGPDEIAQPVHVSQLSRQARLLAQDKTFAAPKQVHDTFTNYLAAKDTCSKTGCAGVAIKTDARHFSAEFGFRILKLLRRPGYSCPATIFKSASD